jgi:predicted alpha/beta hydrolase family esterase
MHHPLNIRPYRVPVVLTVPGLDNSGPGHWQTIWEQQRHDTHRVDLGMWSRPHRNSWVTRLGQAIRTAQTPIVLCGHSLGCLAIAWWTILEGQAFGHPIAGALFVAPPDCDHLDAADRLAGFGPTPRKSLPFPSLLVASRNDPYASYEWSESLARDWGSEFVDAGALGHINAASSIGDWPDGQALLERLVATATERARDPAPLETRRSIVDRPDARPSPTLLR